MRRWKYTDAGDPPAGAWFTAERLGRHRNGEWCSSSCAVWGCDAKWKVLRRSPCEDIDGFLSGLVRDLGHGENHVVDISRHDGEGFGNWRWITRGEDIMDIPAWIEEVRGLLAGNLRLTLYGDSHQVAA